MRALLLAQTDAATGKLSREQQSAIRDTIEEVVDELDDYADEPPVSAEDAKEDDQERVVTPVLSRGQLSDAWQVPYPVLCVASRSALDESACIMLAQLLEKHGIGAWVQPFADVATAKGLKVDTTDPPLVCLSYLGITSKPAHVRYLVRRLRRVMPHSKFMVGFWMLGDDPKKVEEWTKSVGADYGVTSLAEATAKVVAEAIDSAPAADDASRSSTRDQIPTAEHATTAA
jgi:hypothetical protein